MSILEKLFPKSIEKIKDQARNEGRDEIRHEQAMCRNTQNMEKVDKLFIAIGNEWTKLSIIKVIDFYDDIIIGKDIETQEIQYCLSILIPYSESMIYTLKKLNPYERYALVSHNSHLIVRDNKIIIENREFEKELSAEKLISLVNEFQNT